MGRSADLRALFIALRCAGMQMSVITLGYVGTARYILWRAGLLHFFAEIYGSVGFHYGQSPSEACNLEQPDWLKDFEGTSANMLLTTKAQTIWQVMLQDGLSESQVTLVDDDPQEIASVQGVCRAVSVHERNGLSFADM